MDVDVFLSAGFGPLPSPVHAGVCARTWGRGGRVRPGVDGLFEPPRLQVREISGFSRQRIREGNKDRWRLYLLAPSPKGLRRCFVYALLVLGPREWKAPSQGGR